MYQRFMGSEDYLALTREVVNEIPAKQLTSNETDALQQMLDFLKQLNDTHIHIGNRKLNLLKEIFQDVRDAVSDYVAKMYEIGAYFKGSDKEISQGFKLSLTCPFSLIYPIDWIDMFLEKLNDSIKQESIHQDLFAALREKIDIPDMMATAFEKCGGFKNAKIEDLLNPKNYFDIKFEMESDDGEKNVGSAGQTYAVTAMLCVARLSLVEKKEKGRQHSGLRFMPIDEAEGIGSNFDLLERIAEAKDYQLISMSINPLDDFRDGEQYLYILNGSKKRKERVSTFAIFSNADEIQKI
jgi:exonuclease SbcC